MRSVMRMKRRNMRPKGLSVPMTISLYWRENAESHRAVHAEHDEHKEEEDGPELAAWQGGHGLRIHLKHQPWT